MSNVPETISATILRSVPIHVVRESMIVPFKQDQDGLYVLCPNDEDFWMVDADRVRFIVDDPVVFVPIDHSELAAAILKFYPVDLIWIENCPLASDYRCPRTWDALTPTAKEDIRYCETCKQDVYRTRSYGDTLQLSRRGHCVAFDEEGEEFIGLISEV